MMPGDTAEAWRKHNMSEKEKNKTWREMWKEIPIEKKREIIKFIKTGGLKTPLKPK